MKSNNPIFARSEGFATQQGHNAYGNATYPGNGSAHAGYGQNPYADPSTWQTPTGVPGTQQDQGRMTIDSVVQKTAMTLGVVIITALATWWYLSDSMASMSQQGASQAFALITVGSVGAFVLSMVNSFKRVISPALVLAFAALQGIALGGISKIMDTMVAAQTGSSSVVTGAVIGTMAAFAGTLAAYKFLGIKLGQKAKTFVVAAMFGMVGLGLMSFVLSLFGIQTGLFGFGTLGMITAIVGLVLGIFMLLMDFDFVEQGIANGLPERESWRAAFAMAVSLVWIYTNLLRLLAIFSQD